MFGNLFLISPPNEITIKKLMDLFESVGYVVRQVSNWELEIRVVYSGVVSQNYIFAKLIPAQNRIVLESYYKYNIDYNDSIFKECMQLSSVYDLIKIVFQEIEGKSDYNFEVIASYPISYSEGFYPKQVIADLRSFDNVLDNLPYDFESLTFTRKS